MFKIKGYCYKRSYESRRCIWHRCMGASFEENNTCRRPSFLGKCSYCKPERLMSFCEAAEYRALREAENDIKVYGHIVDRDEHGHIIEPKKRVLKVSKYKKVKGHKIS